MPTEISAELQGIKDEVIAAIGSTTDPALLTSVLDAIGKLMLNADQRKTGNPAGQLFRMLQAFYLSEKISEKDMLELSARIGRIQLRLEGLSGES